MKKKTHANKVVMAKEVRDGDWFYDLEKKVWLKKICEEDGFVFGTRLGDITTYKVHGDKEVEITK